MQHIRSVLPFRRKINQLAAELSTGCDRQIGKTELYNTNIHVPKIYTGIN